jgi:hypothetical protein
VFNQVKEWRIVLVKRKSRIDRTTRLLVTITLFGGAWFLLKGAAIIWYNTFSKSAYIKNLFNVEYVFSILLLTTVLGITISVFNYLYLEFKTYQYYQNDNNQNEAIKRADDGFNRIFKTIKTSINIILTFVIILAVIEVIKTPIKIWFIVGGFLIVILIVILLYINKDILKKIESITNITESKIKPYIKFSYIAFLVLFGGISITLLSISDNGDVKVKINESNKIPMSFKLQNILEPEIQIRIIREKDSDKPILIPVKGDQFKESSIELLEETSNSNLFSKDNKKDISDVDKFYTSKSKYYYEYTLNLREYLTEGKNEIEILIFSNEGSNKKKVRIVNSILIKGTNIKITKKDFKVKL